MGTPDSSGSADAGVAAASRPLRVLVVDDHRTVADLLRLALSAQTGLECVGTAHSADEALALTRKLRPDALIMDVRLGEDPTSRDGISVIAELTELKPELIALVLTAHADRTLMERAAAAGACGILAKDGSLEELVSALRTSRPGTLTVAPQLLRTLVTSQARARSPRVHPLKAALTTREREVLTCLTRGMSTPDMAEALGITRYTCRSYVKNVLAKLHAHSRHEAVSIAIREGLVDGSAGG